MNISYEQLENMHSYEFKKETAHWTDLALEFQQETGLVVLPDGEDPCAGFVTYDEEGTKPLRFFFFDELTKEQEKKLKEIVREE